MDKIKLSFFGGAREVTGACYLLEIEDPLTPRRSSGSIKPLRVLIDCGMFQGCEDCDFRNHQPFAFEASKIDAVIITHAHVDHIGRLPKLVRHGFRGPIYSTPPTKDLAEILLEDAISFFRPGETELYSRQDLNRTLTLFNPVEYEHDVEIASGFSFRLLNAGHILGSALVRLVVGGQAGGSKLSPERILVFSGDVGNNPSILLPPRSSVPEANILVTESTYGNKRHKSVEDRTLRLERAIEDVAARRGTLMIPAFATERTQEILFEINEMLQLRRVPAMPVFVDSPLAIKATAVFSKYPNYYQDGVRRLFRAHPHLFESRNLKFTPGVQESKAINEVRPPKVVMAGSGMSSGGRILHHEKRYLPDPNSILLVTGYQAAGSLGRRLIEGEGQVDIHGDAVAVRSEIRVIDGYSAHADKEQLLEFVDEMRDNLEKVFVVQGEPDAALGFQQIIQDRLGVSAVAPVYGERFEL